MRAGAGWCPHEGDHRSSYDCQTLACSCPNRRYKRAYTFFDKECFTCAACAFSPRSNTYLSQDDLTCATAFGLFNSSQQCGTAVAENGGFSAARFNSVSGSCSGCTSSFPQRTAIHDDQAYTFYTCNLPQGMRNKCRRSVLRLRRTFARHNFRQRLDFRPRP